MLYIMYNMAQRPPAGIRRDLSGDLRKADEGTRTPGLLITNEKFTSYNAQQSWHFLARLGCCSTDKVFCENDFATFIDSEQVGSGVSC